MSYMGLAIRVGDKVMQVKTTMIYLGKRTTAKRVAVYLTAI
jgi:hypothetical protein